MAISSYRRWAQLGTECKGRRVCILLDANAATNAKVQAALGIERNPNGGDVLRRMFHYGKQSTPPAVHQPNSEVSVSPLS